MFKQELLINIQYIICGLSVDRQRAAFHLWLITLSQIRFLLDSNSPSLGRTSCPYSDGPPSQSSRHSSVLKASIWGLASP